MEAKPRKFAARAFAGGAAGALIMCAVLFLGRTLGLTQVSYEQGLATRLLGLSGWTASVGGFACALLVGGILGALAGRALKAVGEPGWQGGIGIGFVWWFLSAMAIGTAPFLDIQTPLGGPVAGPFSILLGQPSFYILLAAHLSWGVVTGEMCSRGEGDQPRGAVNALATR